jgi:sensor histidine kinase YesM
VLAIPGIVLFVKNKKFAKSVRTFIWQLGCPVLYGELLISLYYAVMNELILWICILSVLIVVFVTLPVVLYIKNKKFRDYILKHKGVILAGFSLLLFLLLSRVVRFVLGARDYVMMDPILCNWIIGILFAVSLIVAVVYVRKYIKIRDDNLKLQIEPHTIRNAIESIRIKIDEISEDINDSMFDNQEYSLLKSKINSLHYEMESACDFLSEIAEDNSYERNMSTIYDELENVKMYLDFKTNGDLWNVSFDVRLNDKKNDSKKDKNKDDILIPSRITTPMIENAFKHGDVNAPDFLSVSFVQETDKSTIEIRNKILKDAVQRTWRGGLGILNMKRRIELYSENIGSNNIALLDNGTDGDYYYSRLTFQNTRE